jgi:hypothetical protein
MTNTKLYAYIAWLQLVIAALSDILKPVNGAWFILANAAIWALLAIAAKEEK